MAPTSPSEHETSAAQPARTTRHPLGARAARRPTQPETRTVRSLLDSLPVRRAGLAVAAVALFAAPLRADTVTAKFNGVDPNQTVTVALGSTNYNGLLAGHYHWHYLSGNPSFAPSFR